MFDGSLRWVSSAAVAYKLARMSPISFFLVACITSLSPFWIDLARFLTESVRFSPGILNLFVMSFSASFWTQCRIGRNSLMLVSSNSSASFGGTSVSSTRLNRFSLDERSDRYRYRSLKEVDFSSRIITVISCLVRWAGGPLANFLEVLLRISITRSALWSIA